MLGRENIAIESCINGRVDTLVLCETRMNGVGMAECGTGGDDGPWEVMVGWGGEVCGRWWKEAGPKGRNKEDAILMSDRVWKCATDYQWKSAN